MVGNNAPFGMGTFAELTEIFANLKITEFVQTFLANLIHSLVIKICRSHKFSDVAYT